MAPFTDTPDKYSLNFEVGFDLLHRRICSHRGDTAGSVQDAQFSAKDGTQLHGWFMYPQAWSGDKASTRPTIMFFQENAGNMAMRLPFLRDLIRLTGCSVFAPRWAADCRLQTAAYLACLC